MLKHRLTRGEVLLVLAAALMIGAVAVGAGQRQAVEPLVASEVACPTEDAALAALGREGCPDEKAALAGVQDACPLKDAALAGMPGECDKAATALAAGEKGECDKASAGVLADGATCDPSKLDEKITPATAVTVAAKAPVTEASAR